MDPEAWVNSNLRVVKSNCLVLWEGISKVKVTVDPILMAPVPSLVKVPVKSLGKSLIFSVTSLAKVISAA